MKRITVCLVIILTCITISFAQKSKQVINISQLIGTTWIREYDNDVWQISFTQDCYISKLGKKGKKMAEHHSKYYLNSTPPEDYDMSRFKSEKVGNSYVGAYIIYKFENKYVSYIDYYTIEKLNEDELVLFHKMIPKSIGGRDISLKFTRKK